MIDGEVTSYFEWIGAGSYRVDERSGSMHGKKFVIREVFFGSDGANFFVRADFHPGYEQELPAMEARLTLESMADMRTSHLTLNFANGGRILERLDPAGAVALGRVLELCIPLAAAGVKNGAGLRFQLSLWQGGLPIDAAPQRGWIDLKTTDPSRLAE